MDGVMFKIETPQKKKDFCQDNLIRRKVQTMDSVDYGVIG